MNSLRQQIEALTLPDDSTGLKQNAVIDKVLEIIGMNTVGLPAPLGATVYIPYAFRDIDGSICSGYDAVRFVGYCAPMRADEPNICIVEYSERGGSRYTEDVLQEELCLTVEDARRRLCKLISVVTGASKTPRPPAGAGTNINIGGYNNPPAGAGTNINIGGYNNPPAGAGTNINIGGYNNPPAGAGTNINIGGYNNEKIKHYINE